MALHINQDVVSMTSITHEQAKKKKKMSAQLKKLNYLYKKTKLSVPPYLYLPQRLC